MKLKVLAFISLVLLADSVFAGQTWVDGYHRKDGTYVQPHVRSTPNAHRYDNFGPGSNPHTPYGRDSDRDGMWNQYDMDDDNDGYFDDYDD